MAQHKPVLLVIIIAAVLMFVRLGASTVFQIAEARNSQAAAEMISRNDYVVPFFNNQLRTDKPPLHYFAIILAYKLGGTNEASSRFFAALLGVALIIAVWFFAKKNAGVETAWWSALILLSSAHTIFQMRLATPDPYLIICHVLSLFCFWEGYQQKRAAFLWLMYALLGLAVLAKGPVGVALPALTILLYLLFKKEFSLKTIWQLQPVAGIIIAALVAAPWFYLVHIKTDGAWTQGFFVQHNLDRFESPVDGHKGPFVLTWLFILMGLFPFSVFIIRAIGYAWKQRKQNSWLFFNLTAAAVVILFYSFSATKLLNYTTPAYPFLALITGFLMAAVIQGKLSRRILPEWIALVILTTALPAGIYIWMQTESQLKPISLLSLCLLAFPLTVWPAFFLYKKNQTQRSFSLVAGGAILVNLLFFAIIFPAMNKQDSVEQMKHWMQAGRPVAAYKKFNEAFVFYYKQPIPVLKTTNEVNLFFQNHPDALILEGSKQPHLADSLNVKMIDEHKDLFSRQHSFLYELNSSGK